MDGRGIAVSGRAGPPDGEASSVHCTWPGIPQPERNLIEHPALVASPNCAKTIQNIQPLNHIANKVQAYCARLEL